MNILDRYKKPTPKFFRVLRNLGIALATIGGSILTAPINLPTWLLTTATYIVVSGTVATAVSQAVVAEEDVSSSSKTKSNGL